jgi:hypothetical protein
VSEITVAQPPLSRGSATVERVGYLLSAPRPIADQQPHPRVDTITDRASPEQVLDELAGALQQPYVPS